MRLLVGRSTALASALIFALLPLQLIFATKVNHEPMALTFILGSLVAYIYWLRSGRTSAFVALCLIFAISTTVDWGAYYIGGILPVFHFAYRFYAREETTRPDWLILLLPLLGVLMFAVFVLHLYWVNPDLLEELAGLAAQRSGLASEEGDAAGAFSNFSLLQKTAERSVLMFTFPVFALAVAGLVLLLAKLAGSARGECPTELVLLLFWVIGAMHILVFRHVSWVHLFLIYYLMVPMAVTTGWMLTSAFESLPRRPAVATVVIFALMFMPVALLQTRDTYWDGKKPGIPALSGYLKNSMPAGSVIFSNAVHHPYNNTAIPHYAQRDIINGVETRKGMDGHVARWRRSPAYFMAYGPPSGNPDTSQELVSYIEDRYEGHRSEWGVLYDLSEAKP